MANSKEPGIRQIKPQAASPRIPSPSREPSVRPRGVPAPEGQSTVFEAENGLLPDESGISLAMDGWICAMLLSDPYGGVRITQADEGTKWWLKWKWTTGKWAGYYLMVGVEGGQFELGASLLYRKLSEVHQGVRRPTKDEYHK